MVYESLATEPSLPPSPTDQGSSSGLNIHHTTPPSPHVHHTTTSPHIHHTTTIQIMEDPQYPGLPPVSSVADDYDVTEKCLQWRNSCVATEQEHFGMSPVSSTTAPVENLDNINFCSTGEHVDNVHCLYQHVNGHFHADLNQNLPCTEFLAASQTQNFTLPEDGQGRLDNNPSSPHITVTSVCNQGETILAQTSQQILPRVPVTRTRRDSEESMDTTSSQTSGPHSCVLGSAFSDTASSLNSAENLIREVSSDDETGSEAGHPHGNACYTLSFDTIPEQLDREESESLSAAATTILLSGSKSEPDLTTVAEPFSSSVELAVDPEFALNPPVVTDNLIVVEDESFLNHSQLSLTGQENFFRRMNPGLHARAATLPDLSAQHRYDEYDVCWVYQDARIFLSDDALLRSSQSSLLPSSEVDMRQVKFLSEGDGEYEDNTEKRRRGPVELVDRDGNPVKVVASSDHTVVMVLLSLCVGVLFIAMGAVRNIQSSLHPGAGLGVTSLALTFAGYALGSLVSSPLVRLVQPRTCLILSIVGNMVFLLANLSPALWLLAPASVLQGLSLAVVWDVVTAYLTLLAQGRAASQDEHIRSVCTRFSNIFSLTYQSSLILGNLSASLLLMFGNKMYDYDFNSSLSSSETELTSSVSPKLVAVADKAFSEMGKMTPLSSNGLADTEAFLSSTCGASFPNQGAVSAGDFWLDVNESTVYMLHGTFIGCALVALGIAIFGVEPLNMNLLKQCSKRQGYISEGLCATIAESLRLMASRCKEVKFLILLPMLMFSVLQFGFVSAEVTMAFVTCPMGIDQVGFSMLLFALGGFPSSFFSNPLTKKCGRLPLVTAAASINLICLIVMAQWEPGKDGLVIVYFMMLFWGISDGIWVSQANGLLDSMFPHCSEATHTGMRVAQGLGLALFLSVSTLVDMQVKVFVMMAACVIALLSFLLVKLRLRCEQRWSQQLVYHICSSQGQGQGAV